jgi:protein TonB
MSAVLPPQGGFHPTLVPRHATRIDKPQAELQPLPGLARLPAPAAASRGSGLAVVLVAHVLFIWVLASGLARDAIEFVKKPIDMIIVPEALPPPPPPPPPKVVKIKEPPRVEPPPAYVPPPEVVLAVQPPPPVIQVVQAEPPKAPVVIAPPPSPEARPAPVKQEISLACPGYQSVLAQTLEDAFERVGIVGTVRTRITVRGSQVIDAVPTSGPREYYKYVQAAIKRMKCSAGGAEEVQVLLDVLFKK